MNAALTSSQRSFRRFAIATLAVTLLVILWGAYVRASGSGAGCGNHWPTCNGEVIPRPKSIQTVIELTHRVTSGLALLMVFGQFVAALVVFPFRHRTVRAAAWSFFFMLTEAGVGAGLVLFEMVAHNKSIARAWWMGAHLVNTFVLIGVLALTVFHVGSSEGSSEDDASPKSATQLGSSSTMVRAGYYAALVALVLVGVSGAIVALGDTLFPSASLSEGFAQDLSPAAHFLIRLRVVHPALASVVGIAIAYGAAHVGRRVGPSARMHCKAIVVAVIAQISIGFLNFFLLAPIVVQLLHLFVADVLWIAVVLGGAAVLGAPAVVESPEAHPEGVAA